MLQRMFEMSLDPGNIRGRLYTSFEASPATPSVQYAFIQCHKMCVVLMCKVRSYCSTLISSIASSSTVVVLLLLLLLLL